jgi:DnaJ-class molecular chaperone
MDDDTFTVIVERGMPDGHQIVFESQADENPDETPGDVIFKIITAPHQRFSRDGDQLHVNMSINLLEALVGFSKNITHLDGHQVLIERTEITKPGEIIKISEEGMPHHNFPSQVGDLFVHFTVIMPTSLTDQQKEVLKETLSQSS